ncbi:MAG: nuclear transport factor 2 family protein [Pseudomonadota bacterium]
MLDAQAFAQSWEDGWNSHDLTTIMAHYRDDIVFRSRKAIAPTGQGELRGRAALRAYWAKALAHQPDLRFSVQDVFEGYEMLVITYLNHRGVRAAETLYFDAEGLVFQAAACHGSGTA